MDIEQRFERLEQRLAALEAIVRRLASDSPAAAARSAPPPPPPPRAASPRPAPPPRSSEPLPSRPAPAGSPAPVGFADPEAVTRPLTGLRTGAGLEEWIGRRGLLAVGVAAVLLAVGYLLKLSFERGWISPALRSIGGIVAGLAVGAAGWRLLERFRTYGAALLGCGAGIIYLAVWAATARYGLMPMVPGILGLALVSLVLAACAFAVDVEALGAAAALGAFLAPVVLGRSGEQADLLLVYLTALTAGLGWVAAIRRWRLATLVVGASSFGLGLSIAQTAWPPGVLILAVGAGGAGLVLGLRERWWETRFLSFWGGWALVGMSSAGVGLRPAVLLAAMALAAPVWHHALSVPDRSPLPSTPDLPPTRWSVGEALYFFATPFLLAWAVRFQAPDLFRTQPGIVWLAVSIPYLLVGYARPRPSFALLGMAALGFGAWVQWPGLGATAVLLLIAVVAALLDHLRDRLDGRIYALAALAAALDHLVTVDLARRPVTEPAFTGSWALTLWASVAVAAALGAGLWRRAPGAEARRIPGALLTLASALLLIGVTGEIGRFFTHVPLDAYTAAFGRGLATAVWWLVAAVALLITAGRLHSGPLRALGVVGLIVVLGYLGLIDLTSRAASDPAFWGAWAVTLWLVLAVVIALARSLGDPGDQLAALLWIAAGLGLLAGITGELHRYFQIDLAPGTGALAGSLAISAWWLAFAAGLVWLGFRRSSRGLRAAGLGVAGLALAKIVLADLSALDSLYRVASVLLLGLVSLSLAYLYHRQDRRTGQP